MNMEKFEAVQRFALDELKCLIEAWNSTPRGYARSANATPDKTLADVTNEWQQRYMGPDGILTRIINESNDPPSMRVPLDARLNVPDEVYNALATLELYAPDGTWTRTCWDTVNKFINSLWYYQVKPCLPTNDNSPSS